MGGVRDSLRHIEALCSWLIETHWGSVFVTHWDTLRLCVRDSLRHIEALSDLKFSLHGKCSWLIETHWRSMFVTQCDSFRLCVRDSLRLIEALSDGKFSFHGKCSWLALSRELASQETFVTHWEVRDSLRSSWLNERARSQESQLALWFTIYNDFRANENCMPHFTKFVTH